MDSVNDDDEIEGDPRNPSSDEGYVPVPIHSGKMEAEMPDVKDQTPTTDEDVQTPALSVFEDHGQSPEIANSTTGPSSSRANLQFNTVAPGEESVLQLYSDMPYAAVAMEERVDQTDYCDLPKSTSFDLADLPDESGEQPTQAHAQMVTQLTASPSDTPIVSASPASSAEVLLQEEPFMCHQENSLIEGMKAVRIVVEIDHKLKQSTEVVDEYKPRHSYGGPKYCRTPENEVLVQNIGLPDRGDLFQDENYIYSYNRCRRIPDWVCRYLKSEHLGGDAKRLNCFTRDPEVAKPYRVTPAHYKGADKFGDSRGHSVTSGQCKWDQDVRSRTNRLSQIFPQNGELNKGLWNDLEDQCGQMAVAYGGVVTITLPIFLPTKYENCGRPEFLLTNRVLGGIHGPHVPTHVAMVLLVMRRDSAEDPGKPIAVGAYQFPNEPPYRKELKYYEVGTSSVEQNCGFTLFGKVKETYQVTITDLPNVEKLPEWIEGLKSRPKRESNLSMMPLLALF